MTTTKTGGPGVAAIPADELAEKISALVGNLNPIDHMDCAALLIATCDLRTREALALTWADVDFDAAALDVRRACDATGAAAPLNVPHTVALPSAAAEALRRRRAVQAAYFKRYAAHLVEQGDVSAEARIVSTPEGKPVRPKSLSRWWHDKRCDFGMWGWTLNDLRKARIAVAAANAEAGR